MSYSIQVLADDSNQDKLRSIIVVFKPLRDYLGQVVPSLVGSALLC